MKTTLTIPINHWRALCHAAPTKDDHFYLNCIRIECKNKTTHMVATTGTYLLATKFDQDTELPNLSFIVPIDFAKKLKFSKYTDTFVLTYELHNTTPPRKTITVTTALEGSPTLCAPIENVFPDWRILLKGARKPSGECAQFDPRLVSVLDKCADLLAGTNSDARLNIPTIHHNGNNAALVSFRIANAIGLIAPIMPRYVDSTIPDISDWSNETPAPQQKTDSKVPA